MERGGGMEREGKGGEREREREVVFVLYYGIRARVFHAGLEENLMSALS